MEYKEPKLWIVLAQDIIITSEQDLIPEDVGGDDKKSWTEFF